MAVERSTIGVVTEGSEMETLSSHAALVARFRDALADRDSPLDNIPARQFEQARRTFRKLPEVAGKPLPLPGDLDPNSPQDPHRTLANAMPTAEACKAARANRACA
jgi:hypothetical protein